MKKLIVIMFAGCAFALSQGGRNVAAEQGYTPLEEVAGTYAFTGHGSVAVCLANTPPSFPPTQCGSPGSIVVALTLEDVGVNSIDATGNTCATVTETEATSPISASPTTVFAAHIAGPLTSYDPTTGTGEGSFTSYAGGQCHGAIFDSTGATVSATGTSHFAVSNRGKRIDFLVTSITNATGSLGGFSISGTEVRE